MSNPQIVNETSPTGSQGPAGPTGPAGPSFGTNAASFSTNNGTLGGPTGSTEVMMGVGGSITPEVSGRVLVMISTQITSPSSIVAGTGMQLRISYGTGTAPANKAALTGTQVGALVAGTIQVAAAAAGDISIPITLIALITGLVVGTTYWLDLSAKQTAGTTASLNNTNVAAAEL